MAKTFRKPIDKFDRQARLAGQRQQHFRDTERQDLRQAQRMGWVPQMEEDETDDTLELTT